MWKKPQLADNLVLICGKILNMLFLAINIHVVPTSKSFGNRLSFEICWSVKFAMITPQGVHNS